MNAILDGGCLAEVLGHLTDWGLCCARRVCTAWRDAASTAGVWRAVFEGMHGAHSVHWAAAHEPVALAPGDDEWRARCALRRRAATNRRRGLARARLLPFEMGPTAASSPFFVVSLAVDGPWLALGGHGHVSLHDLRTGKRCWQQPHAASAAGSDDSAHLVSMVTVCAVSGHVAALTPADGTVIVRSLTSGDLLHRVDHFELLRGLWGELTHLHGGVEVHTPAGRLERMCTYSPARLGLESGPEAGPLRLVTVAQLPEPGEDRDGELVPAPLVSLLWLLPTEADAAAPPKLLRAREGAMSEQEGVMAEVYLTPGPRADGPYELLLLDVLTLRPVGKAVLALRSEQAHAFDYADCMRKAPTFVSIQRRGERRWVFVLESPKPRSHGADAGVYLEVWSLRSRQSADEIRESHTAGGGGLLPAAQSLCDPEEALRTAPQLEASLLQVIDVASPLYIWGDEDRSPVLRLEWPSFDRHRSAWLVYQHTVRVNGVERPGLLHLDSGERHLGAEGAYVGDCFEAMKTAPRVPACTDLRLLWADAASEPAPWLLLERPGESRSGATEVVRFECWQLTAEGEEGEGEGESGGEEGEEGEEEGEERGEDGATSGRLRKGPALRTTHASAAMRQLMGSTPVPFELLRMACSEPLVTAASWRWLVLLDMHGVHILDFGVGGFRGR